MLNIDQNYDSLPPSAEAWPDVSIIGLQDRMRGGINGELNQSVIALWRRTMYLKGITDQYQNIPESVRIAVEAAQLAVERAAALNVDTLVRQESGKALISISDLQKLSNIDNEATKNDTDDDLRDRSTHTGTQGISTINGLNEALTGLATKTSVAQSIAAAVEYLEVPATYVAPVIFVSFPHARHMVWGGDRYIRAQWDQPGTVRMAAGPQRRGELLMDGITEYNAEDYPDLVDYLQIEDATFVLESPDVSATLPYYITY